MELTGGRGLQSSSFYFACTLSSDSLLDTSRRALKGHKESIAFPYVVSFVTEWLVKKKENCVCCVSGCRRCLLSFAKNFSCLMRFIHNENQNKSLT